MESGFFGRLRQCGRSCSLRRRACCCGSRRSDRNGRGSYLYGGCHMYDGRLGAALYSDFQVAAFEFKLGDVFLDEKVYEFFEFFLVHSMCESLTKISTASAALLQSV